MATAARVSPPQSSTGNVIRDSSLGLVPETLEPYLALNRALWHSGPLSPAEIEMARLRNARRVNCVFCRNVRYDIAREAGLDEGKVQLIEDNYAQSSLSNREKLLLAYTDQYLNDPGNITEALKKDLSTEFSAEELVHLSLVLAIFNGFSRCAVALGGMPDSLPVMEISLPE